MLGDCSRAYATTLEPLRAAEQKRWLQALEVIPRRFPRAARWVDREDGHALVVNGRADRAEPWASIALNAQLLRRASTTRTNSSHGKAPPDRSRPRSRRPPLATVVAGFRNLRLLSCALPPMLLDVRGRPSMTGGGNRDDHPVAPFGLM